MNHPLSFPALRPFLKEALKAKGLTYKDLAEGLGMSEANVKKLMTAGDCSLNRLNQICSFLELSLADLITAVSERPVRRDRLTTEQESLLMEDERYLLFYFKIAFERVTMEKAAAEVDLKEATVSALLRKLEKTRLIEIARNGEIRVPADSLMVWEDHGAVAGLIKHQWSEAVLREATRKTPVDRTQFAVRFYRLSEKSAEELGARIADLLDDFERRSAAEDRIRARVTPVTCLFALVKDSLTAIRGRALMGRNTPPKGRLVLSSGRRDAISQ